jgi:hypothetical protein
MPFYVHPCDRCGKLIRHGAGANPNHRGLVKYHVECLLCGHGIMIESRDRRVLAPACARCEEPIRDPVLRRMAEE